MITSSNRSLDQFYTKSEVAEKCINIIKSFCKLEHYTLVEPSAGGGVFLDLMKLESENVLGYDLDPKHTDVAEQDFLLLDTSTIKGDKVYIGNPPFGKNSSLALKFLNKCADDADADYVCLVLPRTFSKTFFKEKVDNTLELIFEENLPKNSFIFNGQCYDVPCVFQVWKKLPQGEERPPLPLGDVWVQEVEPELAEYSIRRVGGRSGKVLEGVNYSPSTTYFVKDVKVGAKDKLASLYDVIKCEASKTVGVRSITIKEINFILSKEDNTDAR